MGLFILGFIASQISHIITNVGCLLLHQWHLCSLVGELFYHSFICGFVSIANE